MIAPPLQVVAVDDVHVSAIAPATLKIPTASRAFGQRRDDLKKCPAHRKKRIVQTILADAGIAMTDLQPKHVGDLLLDRRQIPGDKCDLAKPQISHGALP
jgi:hypothetical protein